MTNYNDGKWWGWNGGDCPVHPNTVVDVVYLDDGEAIKDEAIAKYFDFKDRKYLPIIAFRVVKEHREPREFWVCDGNIWFGQESAKKWSGKTGCEIIHVREVME